jgi:hypothetical protein
MMICKSFPLFIEREIPDNRLLELPGIDQSRVSANFQKA